MEGLQVNVFDVTLRTVGQPLLVQTSPEQAGIIARGLIVSALCHEFCDCAAARRGHQARCKAGHAISTFAIGKANAIDGGLAIRIILPADASLAANLERALRALQGHGIGPDRSVVSDVRLEIKNFRIPIPDTLSGADQLRITITTESPLALGWRTEGELPFIGLNTIHRSLVRAAARWGWSPGPRESVGVSVSETMIVAFGSWVRAPRFSSRTRRTMPFLGVVGHWEMDVRADLERVRQLAAALDLLPIGGRTAFGFGKMRLEVRGVA